MERGGGEKGEKAERGEKMDGKKDLGWYLYRITCFLGCGFDFPQFC